MSLTPGAKLGPYEILAPLGAGGMGEVYKAKDTRLDRTVAIKVLPSHVASHPEVRQRFEREARAVSSLNHPHICTLHDIGSENGIDFMVMEHIEGDTLADRLKKGALPLDQALQHGIEIADALDKAHRQGVVHRDLKPGNIMLTKSGAKLLDFGLAKMSSAETNAGGLSALPTEAQPLTKEGSLLGTFQYMAPEQLEGKEADARTDIFAFGAVLYEMLTGKRAFEGKSQASLIGAILKDDPAPLTDLQPMTPRLMERVVRKCLEKDPLQRWQSIGDMVSPLRWSGENRFEVSASPGKSSRNSHLAFVGLALACALLGAVTMSFLRPSVSSESPRATRFVHPLPEGQELETARFSSVAISPDGSHIAYAARDGMESRLYLRGLEEFEAVAVPDSDGAFSPFFSHDSQWLGFFAKGALRKASVAGGSPTTVAEIGSNPRAGGGASWGADDTIVFGGYDGLYRTSSRGGTPTRITRVEGGPIQAGLRAVTGHSSPVILPDGKTVLFSVITTEGLRIGAASVDTGEWHALDELGSATEPRYLPTGHLLYNQNDSLWAVPFGLEERKPSGSPVPVLNDFFAATVRGSTFSHLDVSGNGTLIYAPSAASRVGADQLVWVDREGRTEPLNDVEAPHTHPSLSPDGDHLAVSIFEEVASNVWIYDLARNTRTRLTLNGSEVTPVWSPDGTRVAFADFTDRRRGIYTRRADGQDEPKLLLDGAYSPRSWSSDGRSILFTTAGPNGEDVWVLPLANPEGAFPLLETSFYEKSPVTSPDGRWLVYISDESGQFEIYAQSFPEGGGRSKISSGGGVEPRWSKDGQEIFFRRGDAMMVVPVDTSDSELRAAAPQLLFEGPFAFEPTNAFANYDVTPDGERFVMVTRGGGTPPRELRIVLNWFEELKELVPTN